MTKYARIFIQYRYQQSLGWIGEGNVGDCFQNIAVENIYSKMGISADELLLVNRDDLQTYDGPTCKLVMQSWFADYMGVFQLPWSDKITPIFLGFHLNDINGTRERFLREKIHLKMKAFEPIGCRDRSTRDFLIANGVDAYFSGCMTLTYDKRTVTPTQGKVFIVDLDNKIKKKLPKKILRDADTSITHLYYWDKYPITRDDAMRFEEDSRKILERYKNEARLVITSRIHVAMPCVAMGIPVIFMHNNPSDVRFDVLRGILPIYTKKDIKYVDWNTCAPDIEQLKQAIIKNACAVISGQDAKTVRAELINITENLPHLVPISKFKKILRFMGIRK